MSIANDRQLCLLFLISYNESLLKKLHDHPEVRTMSTLSIPLPDINTEEDEEDMDTTLTASYIAIHCKFHSVKIFHSLQDNCHFITIVLLLLCLQDHHSIDLTFQCQLQL